MGAGDGGGVVRGGGVRGVADGAATVLPGADARAVGPGAAALAARGARDGAGGRDGGVSGVWDRLFSGAGAVFADGELAGGGGVLRGDLDAVGLFEGPGAGGGDETYGGVKAVSLALDAHLRRGKAAPKMGHPGMGGKVLAIWGVRALPGSFAALRMTARTDNGKQQQRQGLEADPLRG
jgi:hypothetical protein